jgi:WD repeat-containing protein 24
MEGASYRVWHEGIDPSAAFRRHACFAMADLSPFQRGYGSLQCFSVYQDVPNKVEEDFLLTSLRQDEFTALAPGVFREDAVQESAMEENERSQDAGKRLPASVPELVFSVVDQGNLDENGLPIPQDDGILCVAPEVVHLSRFARSYKMYPDSHCSTRVDLCTYNGVVAEELNCMPLARMWKSVSSLLHGSSFKGLPSKPPSRPANAFQFAIFPTVRSLLLERAEAGDVQTCVVLCEVLQVIESGEKTRIPGLGMSLVREWYLSYIDLLHQMCLFSAASFLIKNCNDEIIGALNQQSTT